MNGRMVRGAAGWIAASLACTAYAEGVKLELKFKAGQERYVEVVENRTQLLTTPGEDKPKSFDNRVIHGTIQKVESATPERAVLSLTYEHLAMKAETLMGMLDYDSDLAKQSEDAGDVEPIFKPMIGESVKLEIGPDGSALGATGSTELLAKVEKATAGNMLFSELKGGFTDDALVTQHKQRHAFVTGKPVSPGDTWKRTLDVKLPRFGNVTFDYDFVLKSVEKADGRTVATIEYKLVGKAGAKSEASDGGPNLTFEKSSGSGTVTFDVDAGQVLRESAESEMSLWLQAGEGGEAAGGENKLALLVKRKTAVTAMTLDERKTQKAANAKGK
jgi:Family of unknown function (DUF6263)